MSAEDSTTLNTEDTADARDRDRVRDRLMRCFRAVFGALTPEEIPAASAEWVAGWDSVATVTLAAVIEEEFGIQFDASELEQITSFSGILAILERRMRD